jgi:hypothetical protein
MGRHVALGRQDKIKMYTESLRRNFFENIFLERRSRKWGNNIKFDFREEGCEERGGMGLTRDCPIAICV